jgi:hypothetical protein
MPVQPPSQLQRLVQRVRRNDLLLNACNRPAASSSLDNPNDPSDANNNFEDVQIEDNCNFNGLNWSRVQHLERRGKEHMKGPPSWIYCHGWPVHDRSKKRNYWLCRYCHVSKKLWGGMGNLTPDLPHLPSPSCPDASKVTAWNQTVLSSRLLTRMKVHSSS